VKLSTSSVSPGGTVRVKVTVRNTASRPAKPKPLLVELLGDPSTQKRVSTPTIPARSKRKLSVNLTLAAGVTSGHHTVRACLTKKAGGRCTAEHADAVLDVLAVPAPARLTVSPQQHAYGVVLTNASAPQLFTVKNVGGVTSGPLTTSVQTAEAGQFGTSGDSCSGSTLAGGATCTVTVTFAPSTTGAKSATLQVSGTSGGTATASLTGTGQTPPPLTLSPAQFDFGAVAVQTSKLQQFTVTNTSAATLPPLAIQLSGPYANQFSVSSDTCSGNSLAAGAACTFKLGFQPTKTGVMTLSLKIVVPGGAVAGAISPSATGANPAELYVEPPQQFGNVAVGSSAQRVVSLTNIGGVPTGTLSMSQSGDTGQFTLSDNTCTGQLAAGATCTLTVTFTPASPGPKNTNITFQAFPGGLVAPFLGGTGV
jgi:hypothetical protein